MHSGDRGRSSLGVQCLVYLAFAAPIGMLGAGWPEARSLFDRSAGSLGLVAGVYGFGRLVTAPSAGWLLRRRRIGPMTAMLCAVLGGACTVVALTRSFPVLVVAFAAVGLLSGCIDSLGNRYQTTIRHVGRAGLMFGSYGVGATAGPALVALTSWRVGFLCAAAVLAAAAVAALGRSVDWPAQLNEPGPRLHGSGAAAVPVRVLVLTLGVVALYCGMEIVTANWAASYLEEARGVDARWAAWATSGFWGGMTAGRLLLGRVRAEPRRLLRVSAGALLVALASLSALPAAGAAAAFTVVGLLLAPMFPTLMAGTADRVGVAATARVTGWQLLAANLSGTALSAAVGLLVDATGPHTLAVVTAAMAVVGLPVLFAATDLHAGADR